MPTPKKIRLRHGDSVNAKPLSNVAFKKALKKLEVHVDEILARATCTQVDDLAAALLLETASVAAIHRDPDMPDSAIENAKILFPTDPVRRLIEAAVILKDQNPHLTGDEVVDYMLSSARIVARDAAAKPASN
jgi:hypothetical protein